MNAHGFRKDLWDRWKKETISDKESYVIGMGDYTDSFRPTIRKILQGSIASIDPESYEQIDYPIMAQMQKLAEEFKPFKHRIIGLLEGHHYHKFISGMTSTQYLCQLLGVKYLDFFAGIQLIVKRCKKDSSSVDIIATHGCGGAQHQHSDISKMERGLIPSYDVDIILRGHSTKVSTVFGPPLFGLSRNTGKDIHLNRRQRLMVNTGGFMEGYTPGRPSGYVEQTNLTPCALGWPVIEIKNKQTVGDNFEMTPLTVVPA